MFKSKTKYLDKIKTLNQRSFTIHEGEIEIRNLGRFTTVPQVALDISLGNIESLESAFDHELDINGKIKIVCKTPLDLALITEQFGCVKWLVSHGADLNAKGNPSFLTAIGYGNEEVIRYLAENGADINATNTFNAEAYEQTLSYKKFENLQTIENLGHTVKKYGGSAFRHAVLECQKEAIDFFICHGVDINYNKSDIVFPNGETPLCIAARNANFDMIEYLVTNGADVTIPDKMGMRPYDFALERGDLKMIEYFKKLDYTELYNPHGKQLKLKKYKLPNSLIQFLQKQNPYLEFGKNYTIPYIKFFSLADTVEMKVGQIEVLRISMETGDYPDLLMVWNPKNQCISYYDYEHEEFGNIATFDQFMKYPGEYVENIFSGEY